MRTKFNIQNLHITPECISPDYHYSDAISIRLLHSILKNFGTFLPCVLLSTSKLMEIRGWFQSCNIWYGRFISVYSCKSFMFKFKACNSHPVFEFWQAFMERCLIWEGKQDWFFDCTQKIKLIPSVISVLL